MLGLEDLDSDAGTDDEDCPRKQVKFCVETRIRFIFWVGVTYSKFLSSDSDVRFQNGPRALT